jgi:hypothetical protein
MAQIERQRSVAGKAGQMQIFNSGEGIMKRGPIPNASLLLGKQSLENPSLTNNNRNFGDYVGRRQMIEQQREKKNAYLREMEITNDQNELL